jgi:hypothetical protein
MKREVIVTHRWRLWVALWLATAVTIVMSWVGAFSLIPRDPKPAAVFRVSDIEVQNQIQMTSSTGPTITAGTGDPNAAVTQPQGSIRMRTDSALVYQNTDGAQTWRPAVTAAGDHLTLSGATMSLSQIATAHFLGRTTAGTGNVEDLTQAQATALLNTFTSTLKGVAPASGGGTSTFLRADGAWATASNQALGSFFYGDGRDGALAFDCVNSVTLSNGTVISRTSCNGGSNNCYVVAQDIEATDITVANNCEVIGNVRYMATGTITLSGANAVLGCNAQNGGVGGTANHGVACGSGTTTVYAVGGDGADGGTAGAGGTGATSTAREPKTAGGAATSTSTGAGTSCGTVIGRGGGAGGNGGAVAGGGGGAVTAASSTVGGSTIFSLWQGHADGTSSSIRWTGGSGGGGGGSSGGGVGGGGGGGGGWAVVAAASIQGTGRISARGGVGATATGTGGGGGGGGGGYATVLYGTRAGTVTIDANGGAAGNGAGGGGNGAAGCAGQVFLYNLSGDGT